MAERYLSIAREIRNAISKGLYPVGSALPGRLALAKTHDTTRGTMDRTIRFLVEQGVVESRHGAGTFVCSTKPPILVAVVGLLSGYPALEGIRYTGFTNSAILQKSVRDGLRQFDAIIWYLPDAEVRQWAAEFPASLVQIIINRDYPECNYVTTDHCGAYAELTAERLKKLKNPVPVFIRSDQEHYVIDKRLEGFSQACRAQAVPFEVLLMGNDFEQNLKKLDRLKSLAEQGPLLLCGASLQVTGCVMAWLRMAALEWGTQVLYNDMDNEFSYHVFGHRVTTFIQDYAELMLLACQALPELIAQNGQSLQQLVRPRLVQGDT